MNTKLLLSAVSICSALLSNQLSASEFETSSSITLASQYIFRGLDASQQDPTFQGDITINHKSGFWFTAWASNYDFGSGEDGIEVDLVAGYGLALTEGVSLGFALTEYTYTGASLSTTEYNVSLSFSNYSLGYYRDVDLDSDYFSADAEFELNKGFSLNLHAGNTTSYIGGTERDLAISINYAASEAFTLFASLSDRSVQSSIQGTESYFVLGGNYSF